MYCPNCGTELSETTQNICESCGNEISAKEKVIKDTNKPLVNEENYFKNILTRLRRNSCC